MPHKDPDKHREASRKGMRKMRAGTIGQLAEKVKEAADLPEPPEREELLRLLGSLARDGQVTAIRLLLEEQRRGDSNEAETPLAAVDELAERRSA